MHLVFIFDGKKLFCQNNVLSLAKFLRFGGKFPTLLPWDVRQRFSISVKDTKHLENHFVSQCSEKSIIFFVTTNSGIKIVQKLTAFKRTNNKFQSKTSFIFYI